MNKRILTVTEMDVLKGMSIYWREAFQRNDSARGPIMLAELANVSQSIGAEKVLRILYEYVETHN